MTQIQKRLHRLSHVPILFTLTQYLNKQELFKLKYLSVEWVLQKYILTERKII